MQFQSSPDPYRSPGGVFEKRSWKGQDHLVRGHSRSRSRESLDARLGGHDGVIRSGEYLVYIDKV
jgi:hypothetical protein